jgi:hypothetical protein
MLLFVMPWGLVEKMVGSSIMRVLNVSKRCTGSHHNVFFLAPFYLKFAAGALTGGVGSVVGNPFDVLKTISQANQGKSVGLSTLVSNMYSEQGMAGFYRGLSANVMRACVLNATKMGCYDISKGYVTNATGWDRKDVRTSFSSATIAGLFMTITVSPFDRIRTVSLSLNHVRSSCFYKINKSLLTGMCSS